jgi:long-chain acyl-CoA synthetase
VAEVGVAGVPDKRQGEAVKAWVVLCEGQEATVDEIRAYCREQLAAYKVPRSVEFRKSLPKSAVGKVLRVVLFQALFRRSFKLDFIHLAASSSVTKSLSEAF